MTEDAALTPVRKEFLFSISEYHARFERAQTFMFERGIDALLVGTGPNLTYLSGYPSPDTSASRPFLLLLPQKGEPALIVQDGRLREAKRLSWIEDVRAYHELSHLPLTLLATLIQEKGLSSSKVGIELGNEMGPNYPVQELRDLNQRFPNLTFPGASNILWDLRIVKSAAELDFIRCACAITARAYAKCFSQLKSGMTEFDAARLLTIAHLEEGGSAPWVFVTSGSGNYDLASKPASGRQLRTGDLIWFDSGCAVGGYNSDFSRAAVIGRASTHRRRVQASVNEATAAGVEVIKPGATIADVARASNRVLEQAGLATTSNLSGLAARVGHGLGLSTTELPHVTEAEAALLRPGMVITVEPGVATAHGLFHHEQVVAVTESGNEVLSRVPVALFEVDVAGGS